mmetsp:Transcript_104317/g.277542  ORF Transcript_104317/g.277542 Transcript_104317/m.277542 type:complete len:204 (+) Transcript_104317:1203-1814(+)
MGAHPPLDHHLHLCHHHLPDLGGLHPGARLAAAPRAREVVGHPGDGDAHALRGRHGGRQLVRGHGPLAGGVRSPRGGVHHVRLHHHVRRLQLHHRHLLPQRHRDGRAQPGPGCTGDGGGQAAVHLESQEALPGRGRRPLRSHHRAGARDRGEGREGEGLLCGTGPRPQRLVDALQAHRGEEQPDRPGRLREGLPSAERIRAAP